MATNRELTVSRRAVHYFRSAPHIVGSLLALGGLGLLFAGIIHAYWWAVVGGLYGVGAIVWPRSERAPIVQDAELPTEMLRQQIRKLVENVEGGLPFESFDALRSIQDTLNELLPRLEDLENRGIISQKDTFIVLETVRRYLPDTLAAYLRLPKGYALTQRLADGRTASQTLLEQLGTLNWSLKRIARNAFAGDGEMLIRNGQFLEARFAEKTAFRP